MYTFTRAHPQYIHGIRIQIRLIEYPLRCYKIVYQCYYTDCEVAFLG